MLHLLDSLEPRRLLAAVGIDPLFMPGGESVAPGTLVGVQPDGRPISFTNNPDTAFLRFSPDGSADPTFVIAPVAQAGLGSGWGEAKLDGQGRLIHAWARDTTPRNVDFGPNITRLRRYTADGVLDKTFAGDGEIEVAPDALAAGKRVYLTSMSVNAGGQILLGIMIAQRDGGGTEASFLARYTPDGVLDPTWGNQGYAEIGASRTHLRDDGSAIVYGGNSSIVALDARGRRRADFGVDGQFAFSTAFRPQFTRVLNVDDQDRVYVYLGERSVKVAPDGTLPGGLVPRSLTRLLKDGAIDRTFGTNGFTSFDIGDYATTDNGYEAISTLAFDPAGRLILAGGQQLIRLTPDGQFDTTFDYDGRAAIYDGYLNAPIESSVTLATADAIYVPRNDAGFERLVETGRWALRRDGVLVVAAQRDGARIGIFDEGSRVLVTVDGASRSYLRRAVKGIEIHLSDGDDALGSLSVLNITVYAGAGDDKLDLEPGDHVIHTGDGNDTFVGGYGNDTVINSGGVDSITIRDGNAIVSGAVARRRAIEQTSDTLAATTHVRGHFGDRNRIRLTLGEGDDTVFVRGGRFSLADSGGSNRFELRTDLGASVALGGGRNVVDTFSGDDTITTGGGRDSIRTRAGDDSIAPRRSRYGAPLHDARGDTIDAGDGDDTIYGSFAADLIYGGAGRDVISPLHGPDTIYGGPGRDTAFLIDEINLDEDDNHIESVETRLWAQ